MTTRTLTAWCPRCGGDLLETTDPASDTPITIHCKTCHTVPGFQPLRPNNATTDEHISRAGHPFRTITSMDPGNEGDGHGMLFNLDCGHQIRLQRKDYRYSQKRARCHHCPQV